MRRYESAMFWLAFGTAAAVIGLALMTIGVTRMPAGANVFISVWFDVGLGLLALGGVLLLWALLLYFARRRTAVQQGAGPSVESGTADDKMAEAIKGYYAERNQLLKMWDRQQRGKKGKS